MPTTEPGPRLTRQERLILLVLATVQFTSIVDFMVIMPLAPQLKRAIGLTTDRFPWWWRLIPSRRGWPV